MTLLPFDGWYTRNFAWGRRPLREAGLARLTGAYDLSIGGGHSTRLHLRFAVATAVVIATAGVALLWYVQRQEVRQAERTVSSHTEYAEESILRDELRPKRPRAPRHRRTVEGARRPLQRSRARRRRLARQDLPQAGRARHVLERALADRPAERRPRRVPRGARRQDRARRRDVEPRGRPGRERQGARGLRAAAAARTARVRTACSSSTSRTRPSPRRSVRSSAVRTAPGRGARRAVGRRSSRWSSAWCERSSATALRGTPPSSRSRRRRSSCASRRRWTRSDGSPAASRTTSTICCSRSTVTPTSSSTTLVDERAEALSREEIQSAGERAAALTQQLLAFSRKPGPAAARARPQRIGARDGRPCCDG